MALEKRCGSRLKRLSLLSAALLCLAALAGCGAAETKEASASRTSSAALMTTEARAETQPRRQTEAQTEAIPEEETVRAQSETAQKEEASMKLSVNGRALTVRWEDNESVAALRALAAESPLRIQMRPYGGFEQVGSIGRSLPENDVQTTTEPGDVVLYSGDQIVVFYGSNRWAYTRLGKILGMDSSALAELLGGGAVELRLSVGTETEAD